MKTVTRSMRKGRLGIICSSPRAIVAWKIPSSTSGRISASSHRVVLLRAVAIAIEPSTITSSRVWYHSPYRSPSFSSAARISAPLRRSPLMFDTFTTGLGRSDSSRIIVTALFSASSVPATRSRTTAPSSRRSAKTNASVGAVTENGWVISRSVSTSV